MRKNFLISFLLLIVSIPTFAGGLLTNTNQHAAFLRMLSRGATTEIDGALSNPAGLAFLPNDGFHMALSIQSAFQTRDIDANFSIYNVRTTGYPLRGSIVEFCILFLKRKYYKNVFVIIPGVRCELLHTVHSS